MLAHDNRPHPYTVHVLISATVEQLHDERWLGLITYDTHTPDGGIKRVDAWVISDNGVVDLIWSMGATAQRAGVIDNAAHLIDCLWERYVEHLSEVGEVFNLKGGQ